MKMFFYVIFHILMYLQKNIFSEFWRSLIKRRKLSLSLLIQILLNIIFSMIPCTSSISISNINSNNNNNIVLILYTYSRSEKTSDKISTNDILPDFWDHLCLLEWHWNVVYQHVSACLSSKLLLKSAVLKGYLQCFEMMLTLLLSLSYLSHLHPWQQRGMLPPFRQWERFSYHLMPSCRDVKCFNSNPFASSCWNFREIHPSTLVCIHGIHLINCHWSESKNVLVKLWSSFNINILQTNLQKLEQSAILFLNYCVSNNHTLTHLCNERWN